MWYGLLCENVIVATRFSNQEPLLFEFDYNLESGYQYSVCKIQIIVTEILPPRD